MSEDTKATILIVDNHREIVQLLEDEVSVLGDFHTVSALSGIEALEKVEKFSPDLILMDIMLGDMEATELCRAIKSLKNASHIPVVAITTIEKIKVKRREDVIGSGLDEYSTEPFTLGSLKDILDRYLGRTHTNGSNVVMQPAC
jgi:CheY-like chemotaxis protein